MLIKDKIAKIYILSGKSRSGKDSLADYMIEEFEKNGLKSIKLQFSSYMKMYAKVLTGWDGSEDTKPRTLLQELGTDIIRNKIDKDFFIKRIIEDIRVYSFFYDIIIVSDARFKEEIIKVKDVYKSVKSIYVERPDYENELTEKEKEHVTEKGLEGYNDFDYKVINNASLDNLKENAINIVKEEI